MLLVGNIPNVTDRYHRSYHELRSSFRIHLMRHNLLHGTSLGRKGLTRVHNIDDNVRRMLVFGLVVLVALVAFTGRLFAQSGRSASVPFAVGEELVFHAKFGKLPAGSARMRVQAIDTIRGRPAYHVVFAVDGGIPLFRVHDRYESWIDVET